LERNHPEPFLTKRPAPPEEGNKVGLCFERSAADEGDFEESSAAQGVASSVSTSSK